MMDRVRAPALRGSGVLVRKCTLRARPGRPRGRCQRALPPHAYAKSRRNRREREQRARPSRARSARCLRCTARRERLGLRVVT